MRISSFAWVAIASLAIVACAVRSALVVPGSLGHKLSCHVPDDAAAGTIELWLAAGPGSEVVAIVQRSAPGDDAAIATVGANFHAAPDDWPEGQYAADIDGRAVIVVIGDEQRPRQSPPTWGGVLANDDVQAPLLCHYEGPGDVSAVLDPVPVPVVSRLPDLAPAPPPTPIPDEIPWRLVTPRFEVDGLEPEARDTTTIRGPRDRDSSRWAGLVLRLHTKDEPVSFRAVELMRRSVPLDENPEFTPAYHFSSDCGNTNDRFEDWTSTAPAYAVTTAPPGTQRGTWDLHAAANTSTRVVIRVMDDQVPPGWFAFIVKLTETDGTVHWVASPAIQLIHETCMD